MSATFQIKRHDLEPSIRVTVKSKSTGLAIDLTGYTSANFIMRQADAVAPKVDAAAVIEDAAGGILRYDWASGDTDTAGIYDAEFSILTPGAKQRTFPGSGFIRIAIDPDLDDA